MYSCGNTGGQTEDNAVIHEKTHGVLFASNEYFKSIFLRDFPANGTKFINKGHESCAAQLSKITGYTLIFDSRSQTSALK